jgi:carbonic anhydrase
MPKRYDLARTCVVFDDLLEANRRYQSGFEDNGAQGVAARGLAVVTCIDSRIDPLGILGLSPGDAKIIRNAGARVTDDVLRSLILATNLLGVTRICLVQHTECAVMGSTNEDLQRRVSEALDKPSVKENFLASTDARGTIEADADLIRSHPLIPKEVIVGTFVYDVRSGYLKPFDDVD